MYPALQPASSGPAPSDYPLEEPPRRETASADEESWRIVPSRRSNPEGRPGPPHAEKKKSQESAAEASEKGPTLNPDDPRTSRPPKKAAGPGLLLGTSALGLRGHWNIGGSDSPLLRPAERCGALPRRTTPADPLVSPTEREAARSGRKSGREEDFAAPAYELRLRRTLVLSHGYVFAPFGRIGLLRTLQSPFPNPSLGT